MGRVEHNVLLLCAAFLEFADRGSVVSLRAL